MSTSLGVLAPGMLIAAPPLGDPNFDRTVVLLAAHGADGALGFVVNRLATVNLAELLMRAGYQRSRALAELPVYVGGPVQPTSGWILSIDPDLVDEDGVMSIGDRVRVSSSRAAFDELARDVEGGHARTDARRRRVMLGYSGWGRGQLEGEIAAGAWLPVPLDEDVLFEVALEDKWERAYATLGLSPAGMMASHFAGEA